MVRLAWPVAGGASLYPIGPDGDSDAHVTRGGLEAIDIPARGVNLVAVHEGLVTRALFANDP